MFEFITIIDLINIIYNKTKTISINLMNRFLYYFVDKLLGVKVYFDEVKKQKMEQQYRSQILDVDECYYYINKSDLYSGFIKKDNMKSLMNLNKRNTNNKLNLDTSNFYIINSKKRMDTSFENESTINTGINILDNDDISYYKLTYVPTYKLKMLYDTHIDSPTGLSKNSSFSSLSQDDSSAFSDTKQSQDLQTHKTQTTNTKHNIDTHYLSFSACLNLLQGENEKTYNMIDLTNKVNMFNYNDITYGEVFVILKHLHNINIEDNKDDIKINITIEYMVNNNFSIKNTQKQFVINKSNQLYDEYDYTKLFSQKVICK